jgi:hypothetical protein
LQSMGIQKDVIYICIYLDDTIYLSKMNSSAVNMNDDCMGVFFKIGGFTANSPGFVGTNVSTNLVIFCTTKKQIRSEPC